MSLILAAKEGYIKFVKFANHIYAVAKMLDEFVVCFVSHIEFDGEP